MTFIFLCRYIHTIPHLFNNIFKKEIPDDKLETALFCNGNKLNIPGNKKPHNLFCIQYDMNIAFLAAVLEI